MSCFKLFYLNKCLTDLKLVEIFFHWTYRDKEGLEWINSAVYLQFQEKWPSQSTEVYGDMMFLLKVLSSCLKGWVKQLLYAAFFQATHNLGCDGDTLIRQTGLEMERYYFYKKHIMGGSFQNFSFSLSLFSFVFSSRNFPFLFTRRVHWIHFISLQCRSIKLTVQTFSFLCKEKKKERKKMSSLSVKIHVNVSVR